jgi:hypothetical protein
MPRAGDLRPKYRIYYLKIRFNIILPPKHNSPKRFLSFRISSHMFFIGIYCVFSFLQSVLQVLPSHPFDLLTLKCLIEFIVTYAWVSPDTLAEWSRAWAVLARFDAGILGSNPTRDKDVYVYVYVYSMFVLSCVDIRLAMSRSLVQGVLPTVLD